MKKSKFLSAEWSERKNRLDSIECIKSLEEVLNEFLHDYDSCDIVDIQFSSDLFNCVVIYKT